MEVDCRVEWRDQISRPSLSSLSGLLHNFGSLRACDLFCASDPVYSLNASKLSNAKRISIDIFS